MTGFGRAEGPCASGRAAIEVRSVNHRHLQVQCRTPSAFQSLERALRARVRDRVHRGHVTVSLGWVDDGDVEAAPRVDLERARALRAAADELAAGLGLTNDLDLAFYARQADVLLPADRDREVVDEAQVVTILEQALDDLVAMRRKEGDALRDALETSLDLLASELVSIEARAPERLNAERARLRTRVGEIMEGREVSDDRLELEILLLADKLDIAEEVVRLRTHIAAAREALGGEGPVGKRLGFLGQEMLREINTIGSKANDATISRAVIEMKTELEKIREQVENLE
jgi:uncharacterized protein (TIGR00255 family)